MSRELERICIAGDTQTGRLHDSKMNHRSCRLLLHLSRWRYKNRIQLGLHNQDSSTAQGCGLDLKHRGLY